MILSGSIYELKNYKQPRWPGDPVRMLVMRHWPRGIKRELIDLWIPDAGPSADLLQQYRAKQCDWEAFAATYRTEQETAKSGTVHYYDHEALHPPFSSTLKIDVSPVEWIRNYAIAQAAKRSVMLLCWENKGNCHRFLLKEMIEQKNAQP